MKKTGIEVIGAAAALVFCVTAAAAPAFGQQQPGQAGGQMRQRGQQGGQGQGGQMGSGQRRQIPGGDVLGGVHRLVVNGQPAPSDVSPQMVRGTIMVPLRFVAQYMGAQVDWNNRSRQVRIVQEAPRMVITLTPGSTRAMVNTEGRALRSAPVMQEGRVLLPLREIARFFNARTDYNGQTQTVFVYTGSNRPGTPLGAGAGGSATSGGGTGTGGQGGAGGAGTGPAPGRPGTP